MLKWHIRPTVRNSSDNKTDSKSYRPVMNWPNFLKVLVHLLLPHIEKYFPVHDNQFAYRPATSCIDAINVLKETVMYHNSQRSDVYCAMIDLSKAYDRINNSLLCNKMRETELPSQVIPLIDFMSKRNFCLHILWRTTEWWMKC